MDPPSPPGPDSRADPLPAEAAGVRPGGHGEPRSHQGSDRQGLEGHAAQSGLWGEGGTVGIAISYRI